MRKLLVPTLFGLAIAFCSPASAQPSRSPQEKDHCVHSFPGSVMHNWPAFENPCPAGDPAPDALGDGIVPRLLRRVTPAGWAAVNRLFAPPKPKPHAGRVPLRSSSIVDTLQKIM